MSRKIFYTAFLFLISTSSFAQLILNYGNYKYRQLNYSDAIPVFEYLIKKDSSSLEVNRKLATCYRLTNQPAKAEPLFKKLVLLDTVWTDQIYYAEMLMKNKKYAQAFKFVNTPKVSASKDYRMESIRNSIKNLTQLTAIDSANIKVASLSFNSEYSDFSPVIYKGKLVFTSDRISSSFVKRRHTWTDKNFTNLFYINLDETNGKPLPFANQLRGRLNYGPASFCAYTNTMYYSVNNPRKKSIDGYKNLKILSATYDPIKSKWIKDTLLSFNSKNYECTHPSVNSDGKSLYFSSNMPGGFGGMDIYVCYLVDSQWTKPKNLGSNVNSAGNEVFPFIDNNEMLFFASDGRGGLGGLDIFSFNVKANNTNAENLAAPINSYADDFGLVKFPNEDKGYFSTSRGKSGIDDDIYTYSRIKQKAKTIAVSIVDAQTGKRIEGVNLSVRNQANKAEKNYSLTTGFYANLPVVLNGVFEFTAIKPGFDPINLTRAITYLDTALQIRMQPKPIACIIQGYIKSKNENKKIDSVTVALVDQNNLSKTYTTITDSNGFYHFVDIESNTTYKITATKSGYFSKSQKLIGDNKKCINYTELTFDYQKDFALEQIILGKAIKIDNIYFDVNKFDIRPDAAKELDKVVKLLVENPEIIIELSSHTDARGSDQANFLLSDNRAKSSVAYIISKGIASNRITGKGYGETKLVNKCGNGVVCSDKEHQQNRRTEFQVTGFLGQVNTDKEE